NRLAIPLPQLCKDPDRAPLGACRTCLVHVEGQRGLSAACHLPAREGMVVSTAHPDAVRVRRGVLDLTLSMLTPAKGEFGALGDAAARHGLGEPGFAPLHRFDVDASKSFFVLDREACILCGRCTVACDEVQQIGAIALLDRGHTTRVGVFGDGPMAASVCTSCGQCVATCPTGALSTAAAGLAKHRGRFGALASAKATNEDGYAIQKFCRVVMQTNDVDHCTRLCHSPSVEAMLACMGSGATSNSYQDYAEAGCLMVVGADASANHPVIAIRFRRAVSRGARLIVVNPKRVDLCDQADLWLQPRPGTDVALFNAMARVILDEDLANLAFVQTRTAGFEDWRASLRPFSLEYAERMTGVRASDIAQAARWYARPPFAGSCLIWG